MSLDAIMRSALSGINASQEAMRYTSNNIANVNTPGYVRQEVVLASRSLAGQNAGVEVAEVRRVVDQFLNKELVTASGNYGYFDAKAQLHDRLQSVLGSTDTAGALHNLVDEMFTSFATLSVDPSQTPRRIDALTELKDLATGIDRLARQIQSLREEAERRIQADINQFNSVLSEIHSLNQLIAQQTATGTAPLSLIESRDQAIEKISSIMDIRAVEMPDGTVQLSTVSGANLLDKTLKQLQYNPSGQADTSITYNAITLHAISPATGLPEANGVNLDNSLRGGSLKGYIDMRDVDLPRAAVALGEFAGEVADQINAIHNQYSAVPPPNTLTGTNVGALATDPHGFTGLVTFAVLDANNEISSSYTIDFSAVGLVTLQDVINDVNANVTGGTLALSNGSMTFDATAATDGVVIQQDATTPSDRGGRGFAHFFGMNDVLEARTASHFDTGLTTTAAHGFGAAGTVSIDFRGPGGDIATSYTLDFSAVGGTMAAVITDLNANFAGYASFSLDSNGKLTVTPASGYEGFDMSVGADSSARGATGMSFSRFFGLGDRYRMDAAFSMTVKQSIVDNPSMLALASLDTAAGAGIPALTVGDNSGANALTGLSDSKLVFTAAGNLPSITTSLSEYAGYYLSSLGMEANQLQSMSDDRKALQDEIRTRRDTLSGVNIDEELANMIIYQNAYNAAARLITTANEMFDTLLSINR